MKAADRIFRGPQRLYETTSGGAVLLNKSETLTARRVTVNPGAMIKGDHVTPNSWNYTILDRTAFKGEHLYKSRISPTLVRSFSRLGFLSGDFVGAPFWDRSSVYNMCLDKLNSKVRGDLDLGVSLAEIGSTARMVKALGKVLKHAGEFQQLQRAARRKPLKERFGDTKDIANGWLQWQYGWKPLVSDVFGVADESIRLVINRINSVKASVRLPIEESATTTRTVDGISNVEVIRHGKGAQACTIALRYMSRDFELSRWTSLNPLSLGWELIPFSFVADWFYDAGSYLRNMETGLLYNPDFLGGYKSELIAWDGEEMTNNQRQYSTASSFDDKFYASAKLRYRAFNRTKLVSYPLPRPPSIKVDLSSSRLLTAAALLRQMIR